MGYDFDKIIDRVGTWSEKWKVHEGELPMWVADMDFKTAPEIQDAILRRAAHGIYGYTVIPPEWSEAYIHWWGKRHGFRMEKSWLSYCTGVIPAVSSIIRTLSNPGDYVLIQPPVYHVFYHSILNNGRRVAENPLVLQEGNYAMDFDNLENKLSDPQTTLIIMCNPQNPSGRIWRKEELGKVGELARKYGVTVISDEIHCDLTDPGFSYVPFASVSEICRDVSISCLAPTKTFNLAGMHTAAVSIPAPEIHRKVRRGLNRDEIAEPGTFSIDAAVAAFSHGAKWLDVLREYTAKNKECLREFIREELPYVSIVQDHATYLCWLDLRKITENDSALAESIRQTTGLILNKGSSFGNAGRGFLRMNLACPESMLHDGLKRLRKGINVFMAEEGMRQTQYEYQ